MAPLISVVIPAKDRVEELARAIESVQAQTERDLEIVVVDDGSDTPLDGRVGGAPPDARLRVVRQANAGPAVARNTGVQAALGTYIAFLDSDDTWAPEKLARQIDRFRQRPHLALVGTGTKFVHDDGSHPAELREADGDTPRFWALMHMTTSSVMFRRSVFLEQGGFARDLFFMEDKELFLRIGINHPFETIPDALTIFHFHARQTTGRAWRELSWVERYDRDVRSFLVRIARMIRPGEWRHLFHKVSLLQADVAAMYAQHGARAKALRAQALSAVLSPLDVAGYRKLALMMLPLLRRAT
jgi:glycosyltransferase involved in cell wall biosynthesis